MLEREPDGERIVRQETTQSEHERRIIKLEGEVDELRGFQKWILGAFAAVAFVAGVFTDSVKHLLGLKP